MNGHRRIPDIPENLVGLIITGAVLAMAMSLFAMLGNALMALLE